jgi:hypothetical protein
VITSCKYYFNIFLNKKYFKKKLLLYIKKRMQQQQQSEVREQIKEKEE